MLGYQKMLFFIKSEYQQYQSDKFVEINNKNADLLAKKYHNNEILDQKLKLSQANEDVEKALIAVSAFCKEMDLDDEMAFDFICENLLVLLTTLSEFRQTNLQNYLQFLKEGNDGQIATK